MRAVVCQRVCRDLSCLFFVIYFLEIDSLSPLLSLAFSLLLFLLLYSSSLLSHSLLSFFFLSTHYIFHIRNTHELTRNSPLQQCTAPFELHTFARSNFCCFPCNPNKNRQLASSLVYRSQNLLSPNNFDFPLLVSSVIGVI